MVLCALGGGEIVSASGRVSCEAAWEPGEGETVTGVRALCQNCTANITQGGVEARVQCELEASAASGTVLRQLDSVAVTGETDCHDRPSVTVIRAAEGDTLWSLAKLCGSTPALISALNGLDPSAPLAGKILLIPRSCR